MISASVMKGLNWIVPSFFREAFALFPTLAFQTKGFKVFHNSFGLWSFKLSFRQSKSFSLYVYFLKKYF